MDKISTPNIDHFNDVSARFLEKVKQAKTTTSHLLLSQIERETTIIMTELQLTAPRIWNDFITVAQKRRQQIATGLAVEEEVVVSKKETTTKKKTTRRKKA